MAIQSGNYGRLLEPGLRKLFFESYKEKPEQFTKFVNVLTSEKAMETDMRVGGFGRWEKKGTLDSTSYQDPRGQGIFTYKHETFSSGFQVEKEMVDDEQYNIINKMPKALGRTARVTLEELVATMLNTAFTPATTNFGGEALIANNHTLLGEPGVTTSNSIGAVALTEANLELGMKLSAEQVDERGLKIQVNPDVLIVPRALEFTAEKIVKSVQLPGTNNNDINPMQGKVRVLVLDYLTDSDNWFLMDSTMNPLNFFWRERINFKRENDFDTDASKYKGRFRMSYGWTDFRGILGANP